MGTRGLEIVRFNKRYYIRYHRLDGYFECLGAKIVAKIPASAEEYQTWLGSMRAKYAALENTFEQHIHEIRAGITPDCRQLGNLAALPSELPRLDCFDAQYVYIINLDQEVLTMDFSIHWKLNNIPREDDLWISAIKDSIFPYKLTICPDTCSEEHMASPALELPAKHRRIPYHYHVVTPKTRIVQARQAFLVHFLAEVMIGYKDHIVQFGREWAPDSFPFRELTFALVSIASDKAKFHSLSTQRCNPRRCQSFSCDQKHLPEPWFGLLDQEWVNGGAPLLEFGSMSHRPGQPPGAAPTETMYWLEDVLISIVMVVDGKAIGKAVKWGLSWKHNFQIVVMSLFNVAFAEVTSGSSAERPVVEVSEPINLSPLRIDYCMSTHPRERPVRKPGMTITKQYGELIMQSHCTGTARRLRSQFPGLAALVNFFDAAAGRHAASKPATGASLPIELLSLILDFVDYDTWKTCLTAATELRSCCLRKYRLDDRMSIIAGPFVRVQRYHGQNERLLSYNFEDVRTGQTVSMIHHPNRFGTEWNWRPVIGSGEREALLLDIDVQFEPAKDVPVEVDSDDERS
ncbi:hypothetical protein MPDQ_004440 [Monascus purpureus]|uniref:Uncharacterized protein n=1 Tax=Monascus purpureus TaxID=5098 RepID=A0A507R1X5_MONPU|nr:hypothetical protein MPDQ_004440 [Monascus purpureus]BDD62672.1 hypothetical protein MAP00_007634 [Monascus purpureus]